jgi:UPF0755 protein
MSIFIKSSIFGILIIFLLGIAYYFYGLTAASLVVEPIFFNISKGESFRDIALSLRKADLIKSTAVFKIYNFLRGSAHQLKPGKYSLSPSLSVPEIVDLLVAGIPKGVRVIIFEGETIKDIDKKLSDLNILKPNEFLNFDYHSLKNNYEFLSGINSLEGFLFPDTYQFSLESNPDDILKKFLDNFKEKVGLIYYNDLIIASMIEKEVPFEEDRYLVSGILHKRLSTGMLLQVDATICYAKLQSFTGCYPVKKIDLEINSIYNTYKKLGLPPTPISNPGLLAIKAALNPKNSKNWYYLSDPKTKTTIFAKTLDEHNRNRVKYLNTR